MLSEEWSSLHEYDLHHVIKSCWQDQQTGLLEMRDGEAERSCAWDKGKLVFSNSNQAEDRLPEILIRMGLLDHEQFKAAQENFNPEISVGKNLVECGLITQKELVQGAKEQVTNNFQKCFSHKSCEARFLAGEERLPSLRIPLSVEEGVCAGLMALEDRDWISELFEEDLNKSMRVNQSDLHFKVEFAERVLPLLDGSRDFNQVSFECDVEEFKLMKFLYVLQFLDALEWGAPEMEDQEVKQELSEALPSNDLEEPHKPTQVREMAETAFIPKVIPESIAEDETSFEDPEPQFEPEAESEAGLDGHDPDLIMPEPQEEIFEEKPKGSWFKSPLLLSGVLVLMAGGLLWLINREPEPILPSPEPTVEESLALFPNEPSQGETEPVEPDLAQPQNELEIQSEPELAEVPQETALENDPIQSSPLQDGPQQELTEFVEQAGSEEDAEILPESTKEQEPQPTLASDDAPLSPVALNLPAYKKEDKRRRPPPKEIEKRQMEIPKSDGLTSDGEALQPPPPEPKPLVIEPLPEASNEPETSSKQEELHVPENGLDPALFEEPDWDRVHQFNQVAWEAEEYPQIALNWQAALSMAKRGWTVACMLACQPQTLQQARVFLPDRKKVILIAREFNGKPCYWVCYGVFEDQDAAEAASQQLENFRQYNPDPPRIVPLSELVPNP